MFAQFRLIAVSLIIILLCISFRRLSHLWTGKGGPNGGLAEPGSCCRWLVNTCTGRSGCSVVFLFFAARVEDGEVVAVLYFCGCS